MINFIIYEDDKNIRDQYISIIIKLMGDRSDCYSIVEVDSYDKNAKKALSIPGKKIYILDVEVPGKSGLDLAREIREKGDWESQIIIVTSHDSLQQNVFTSKLLTLNFISKFNNVSEELKNTLIVSYMIVTNSECLKFQYNGEFQQFYYNDILYIKREPNDVDTTIVLADGSKKYTTYKIGKLEETLRHDPRFFRTHRGCIVNIFRIKNVDFANSLISFTNSSTRLLSREKRKPFKEIIQNIYPEIIKFQSNSKVNK